jgi:3',5'-cyclic AMP phosphodiesterase CpdA
LRDLASKRLLSGFAWRRKGREHQRHVLDALVADVGAYGPDHIAITGDLTNFSTLAEFEGAKTWLQGLGPSADVTVSPGNHDALIGARAGRFSAWSPWLSDEVEGDFPHVRVRGPVALVNLCSALPTAPHLATGRLGPEQLARLDAVLADLGRQGLVRVVMLHHPPVDGVVSPRKALEDASALRAVLSARGAELVLHGHKHEPIVGRISGPQGHIPVLGVPSASALGRGKHPPARWHALEIDREDGALAIRVVARGLTPEGGFAPLGAYRLAA